LSGHGRRPTVPGFSYARLRDYLMMISFAIRQAVGYVELSSYAGAGWHVFLYLESA